MKSVIPFNSDICIKQDDQQQILHVDFLLCLSDEEHYFNCYEIFNYIVINLCK